MRRWGLKPTGVLRLVLQQRALFSSTAGSLPPMTPALSEAVVAQWLQLVVDHQPDPKEAGGFVVANRLRESTYEDAVEWFTRVHGTPGGDVAPGSVRPSTATYNLLIQHCTQARDSSATGPSIWHG